jgi:phosphate/sulfate permease
MFLGIVVFLFLLAIFDLVVGVSNDAVNFMNSAIGAKAASFKTIIAIAAFVTFILTREVYRSLHYILRFF